MEGKVISIPLKEYSKIALIEVGMHVLLGKSIVKIFTIAPSHRTCDYIVEYSKSKFKLGVNIKSLSILVVEHNTCCGMCLGFPLDECNGTIERIPLVKDQWEALLYYDMVGSGIEFQFTKEGNKAKLLFPKNSKKDFKKMFNDLVDEIINITEESSTISHFEKIRNFVNRYYKC